MGKVYCMNTKCPQHLKGCAICTAEENKTCEETQGTKKVTEEKAK